MTYLCISVVIILCIDESVGPRQLKERELGSESEEASQQLDKEHTSSSETTLQSRALKGHTAQNETAETQGRSKKTKQL